MSTVAAARLALREWVERRPANFFTSDSNLQSVLRHYLSADRYEHILPRLEQAGADAATRIDAAARLEDEIGNHPRLERYTAIGERREEIAFHPAHYEIGDLIWSSGIMSLQREPGRNVEQMALSYLFGHDGLMSHLCSLGCTMGTVRVLRSVADEEVRKRFLPPLLSEDYATAQQAAEFLTEVQGGSDVGANAMEAVPQPDGTWRLTGEKWFCSNINADQFLMTARPVDSAPGTKGIGLFLVPRLLDNGATNGFFIRRLKEKLGSRTLASAEVDFERATAYAVGPIDEGFTNVVELVLNTARLANAFISAGFMRRAFLDAQSFAQQRQAFGSPVARYPLVQETLADMLTETQAALASSLHVAWLLDRLEGGSPDEDDRKLHRLLVNVNKYWTAIRATRVVHQGIEVLGGNGAIETFSVLPRLYRDLIVLESWEGTHNVLCLQVLRDCARYELHKSFDRVLGEYLAVIDAAALTEAGDEVNTALRRVMESLQQALAGGDWYTMAHARRVVDQFATVAQAALLLKEAQWEIDQGLETVKPQVITHYLNRFIRPSYDPLADGELPDRIEQLASGTGSAAPVG